MGAFGEKLRKQREQRGLALDAISNTTKISTRMLRALEDEHFDQLPGGVFNKGFVRAYARQVGLDEEETVTDYLVALRESQVQAQQILPDFRAPGGKSRPVTPQDARHHILPASNHPGGDGQNKGTIDPPAAERRKEDRRNQDRSGNKNDHQGESRRVDTRLADVGRSDSVRPPHSSALDSRTQDHLPHENHSRDSRNEAREPHDSPSMSGFITLGAAAENSAEPADTTSPGIWRIALAAAFLLIIVGLAVWTSHRRSESAPTTASSSISPAPPPAARPSTPSVTPASVTSPKIDASSSTAKATEAKSSATAPLSPAKASSTTLAPKPSANPAPADPLVAKVVPASPASKPPNTFTLLIRAEQTTWVSIIVDGKPVAHETLIAPAHTAVRATRDVSVRVGNAAGVSFLLNGKEFPAQGNAGEVRTYVFDATGLSAAQQAPAQAPIR